MRKRIIPALLTFGLLILSGCAPSVITKKSYNMDTIVNATVYGASEETVEEMFVLLDEIEVFSSSYVDGAELYELNETRSAEVSDELLFLLNEAEKYRILSNGAFDYRLGSLISLWGIGTENQKLPKDEEISALLANGEDSLVSIDGKNVVINDNRISLDLGGIAKGYGGDRVKEFLIEKGVKTAILDLGGNIILLGDKDGGNWNVGITNPRDAASVIAVYSGIDKAIATSGDYQRFFEENGVRYHHILDPNSGYPCNNGIISATVIAETGIAADALSTACYVLGKDKALELINSLPDTECVLIDEDLNIFTSGGLNEQNFKIL